MNVKTSVKRSRQVMTIVSKVRQCYQLLGELLVARGCSTIIENSLPCQDTTMDFNIDVAHIVFVSPSCLPHLCYPSLPCLLWSVTFFVLLSFCMLLRSVFHSDLSPFNHYNGLRSILILALSAGRTTNPTTHSSECLPSIHQAFQLCQCLSRPNIILRKSITLTRTCH